MYESDWNMGHGYRILGMTCKIFHYKLGTPKPLPSGAAQILHCLYPGPQIFICV